MGVLYRWFARPLLRFQDSGKSSQADASTPQSRGFHVLGACLAPPSLQTEKIPTCNAVWNGIQHPFGLAAGMDKNAQALNGWPAIGLSFIEIGGVTMHSQGRQSKAEDVQGFQQPSAGEQNGLQQRRQ